MEFIKDKRYVKIALIVSIPILLMAQYYLFNVGFLRPMLKGVEIKIVDGDYISDLDKYVVKLDDTVTLSMGEYITIPKYSKEPYLTFKSLDSDEIVSIEGNKMTTLKEGYASIGVMNGSSLLKKATIKVVNPRVEDLELNIEDNLIYVGDVSKINSTVAVDYKGFKEPNKVTYESSNENVLKIEDDKVKAVGVGTATIYAKSGDKVDEATFNIRAKVSSIEIDSIIEISVNEEFKLEPKIITSPKNLKSPKIEYSLVGEKLWVSRAIGPVSDDGTIVGVRPGEEVVKITCGNKSIRVTIKVVEEPITEKNIENLEVSKEIIDNKMLITITWDYLDGVNDYEIYLRKNSLKEEGFKQVKLVTIEDDELGLKTKVETTIEIDITDMDEVDIDLYVVGNINGKMTKPSNTSKIEYKKELESIKNLSGYFDKENSIVKLTWDLIDKEDVTYNIYIKNKLNGEEEFTLGGEGITFNEFTIDISDSEVDLEAYVIAVYGNKTINSEIVEIK